MPKLKHTSPLLIYFSFFFYLLSSFNVDVAIAGEISGESEAGGNPFTPKASLIRYWKKQISNDLPKPWFLLNKASPMSAVEMATFSKLADQNALSTRLHAFCSSAQLLCFNDLSPSLEKHGQNANFVAYSDNNFTNYGTGRLGGVDSFKNYSDGENLPVDSFRRYSRNAVGHGDQFSNYAPDTNVADQRFNTYGTSATGGTGEFKAYAKGINVPHLGFTTYSTEVTGRQQSFSSYSDDANAGDQSFASYGRNGNGAGNGFNSYGKSSNVIGSNFNNYGNTGNGANDKFISYGFDGNVPQNNFKIYGDGGNAAIDSFSSYRDQSNVGDDSFQSYAKNSNAAKVNFLHYGQSFNEGTDKFTGYGSGASGQAIGFKIYGVNNTFKDYAKKGISFSKYMNDSSAKPTSMADSGKKVNRWVEPGKFFREKMLKVGSVMPMPDIRDKMPKRSFLPRVITSKLPFSTSKLLDMKKIFHADDNSSMETIMTEALSDCERVPSRGETKRCVASGEDLIDFATSVLGRNVVVRTTQNTNGSKNDVMIGSLKGIDGGRVTKSVSCHQSLFPYLLYYCHSVPKVRVYEADLLDPKTKAKINHGVAICHIDTSSWSSSHGAFVALGSGPGKIEVCHWIFENDMTWTTAD
ncbi:Polygalacturonase-1 non-catalytic subunit beta like [Actinidia chinensis var. chinensis]|uniref:Polygalacturonase-1 non-catalytic subunit beta like n=1 Tax=Actinidia chinensis var. chinensis TaxID=1590841 RepID=A0A2R6RF40_ACTCC|nr:Polygalacturonase-1 non-catalytic subunit beta like [Actinidia chinensis var. chinensis]